jgi:predicted RNA-binding protein with TRAM domain
MEISDQLQCLFSAKVEGTEDAYTIEIPKQEVQLGTLTAGDTYRIAVLSQEATEELPSDRTDTGTDATESPAEPPVSEGETRTVEIEDVGDQGDGLTRVERGFVVIIPETDVGERVRIEISDVRDTVAFGEVVERLSYYD